MKHRFNIVITAEIDDPIEFRHKVEQALEGIGITYMIMSHVPILPTPAQVIEARKKLGPKGFVQ